MTVHANAPAAYGCVGSRAPISAVNQSGAMTSLGTLSFALHTTRDRQPQNNPNASPINSTTAIVSLAR